MMEFNVIDPIGSIYENSFIKNQQSPQLGGSTSKLGGSRSSWAEYIEKSKKLEDGFCEKDIILKQFTNTAEYKKFALSSLEDILKRRSDPEEI